MILIIVINFIILPMLLLLLFVCLFEKNSYERYCDNNVNNTTLNREVTFASFCGRANKQPLSR